MGVGGGEGGGVSFSIGGGVVGRGVRGGLGQGTSPDLSSLYSVMLADSDGVVEVVDRGVEGVFGQGMFCDIAIRHPGMSIVF
jgi:hypothetical protein